MLKTYIYVPDEINEQIVSTAEFMKKSKAEIMRQALEKGLVIVRQQQKFDSGKVLLKIAELGKKYNLKGPKDAAEHHDKYLYGKGWSR